ncbi:hypothetical protein CBER1_11964 [Cercospora berteroae]|uniref:Integrase catalytic domain-containing protein n=1 Tax=Cercospora berteroae TaxID=357750 RepID=A0A2S6C0M1_9PEZI|nr:hypothetical protein CBER1_11964 [Cercospora berteroae]
MPPPERPFVRTQRNLGKATPKLIEGLHRHHQELTTLLTQDPPEMALIIQKMYDCKETVETLIGSKFVLHRDRTTTKQVTPWQWSRGEGPRGRPLSTKPKKRTDEGDATEAELEEREPGDLMIDPELLSWQGPTEQTLRPSPNGTSLVDDSGKKADSPAPSEHSTLYGYFVEARMTEAATAPPDQNAVRWDEMNDEWYQEVIAYLQGKVPEEWTTARRTKAARYAENFRWRNGKLERLFENGKYIPCVHPRDVPRILQAVHDRGGHFKSETVMKKLRGRVFWPTMAPDLRLYIQSCRQCAMWAQRQRTDRLVALDSLNPWELLQADLIGPFPRSRTGNVYALTIVCCFSNFTVAIPLPDKEASTVRQAMSDAFNIFGSPMACYTDPGKEFANDLFDQMMRSKGILSRLAPAGAHRLTGAVENMNRILRRCTEKQLPIYVNTRGEATADYEEWDEAVKHSTLAANQRHVPSLGYSPSEIMFGTLPGQLQDLEQEYPTERRQEFEKLITQNTPKDIPEGDLRQACYQVVTERREMAEGAQVNRRRVRQKGEDRWNSGITRLQEISAGDWVLVRRRVVRKGVDAPWAGPYQVAEHVGEHDKSVTLKDSTGEKRFDFSRHVGQLRIWHQRPERLQNPEGQALLVEGDQLAPRE